jgi:hypothetical protein
MPALSFFLEESMKQNRRGNAAPKVQAALDALWDAIARALARRWLQDQRAEHRSQGKDPVPSPKDVLPTAPPKQARRRKPKRGKR